MPYTATTKLYRAKRNRQFMVLGGVVALLITGLAAVFVLMGGNLDLRNQASSGATCNPNAAPWTTSGRAAGQPCCRGGANECTGAGTNGLCVSNPDQNGIVGVCAGTPPGGNSQGQNCNPVDSRMACGADGCSPLQQRICQPNGKWGGCANSTQCGYECVPNTLSACGGVAGATCASNQKRRCGTNAKWASGSCVVDTSCGSGGSTGGGGTGSGGTGGGTVPQTCNCRGGVTNMGTEAISTVCESTTCSQDGKVYRCTTGGWQAKQPTQVCSAPNCAFQNGACQTGSCGSGFTAINGAGCFKGQFCCKANCSCGMIRDNSGTYIHSSACNTTVCDQNGNSQTCVNGAWQQGGSCGQKTCSCLAQDNFGNPVRDKNGGPILWLGPQYCNQTVCAQDNKVYKCEFESFVATGQTCSTFGR